MQRLFEQLKAEVGRNSVTWVGPLLPREGGIPYVVKIVYKLSQTPQTWVVNPPLAEFCGRPIPHLYSDGSLCLHLPVEWHPRQLVAKTIVPWVSHWLTHYEVWKATGGEWLGGGLHPSRRRRGHT